MVDGSGFATIALAIRLPKRGAGLIECEDAFALGETGDESSTLRVAVADGASQSLFSARWAQAVADAYVAVGGVERPDLPALNDAIAVAAQEWRDFVWEQDLPWFAQPKRDAGAHAALIGVEVFPDGKWRGTAVGDSCVFRVNQDRLQSAFPLRETAAFPDLPDLIATSADGLPEGCVSEFFGRWQSGDDLYLMTDALAKWFLSEVESDREPWHWIHDIREHKDPEKVLHERISVLRDSGRLRDDDVTLVQIHFPLPETNELEVEP